jgi:hypothetical protein
MGAKENPVMRTIWGAVGGFCRLFRLQSGIAWMPNRFEGVVKLDNGDILLRGGGRPIALGFGLTNGKPASGFGDLFGWTTKEITSEMVGCLVAIVVNIETKPDDEAHKRESQHRVVELLREAGGIAGFAHTPEMAIALIQDWTPLRKKA